MADSKDIAATKPIADDQERIQKFKLDIARDANVTDEQRDQANADMRFINVTGGMWEDFLQDTFNSNRVQLEMDVTSNYLQRFMGEWGNTRTGVEFKPDDSGTTDDDAELLNGIYRSDYRDFSGKLATDNAVLEAATCGYGAFKLATVFEDDEDPENDNQRIEWRPIHNAYSTVLWDMSAQRIDKMDARWVHVLKPYTRDEFEEIWPGMDPVSAWTPNDRAFFNRTRGTPNFVYVATRYEINVKRESLFVYNNLQTREVERYTQDQHDMIKDELRRSDVHSFVRERPIKRRRVMKYVFSGADFLEKPQRVAGKWLPVIPVYGYRNYVDGVEWARGLVRKLKDAQRLFNMQTSQLAENAASAGQEIPIFLRDQVTGAGVADLWKDKNNKPYLYVDPAVDDEGKIIASGPIAYDKPAQLDGSTAALLQIVPGFVQDSTGGAPQETTDPDASGKAIVALQKREDRTTAPIRDNIDCAIARSGEVYQSMAAEIYDQQRILRVIGKDGTERQVQMLKTVFDRETGRAVESNKIRGKRFRAYADTGPAYDSLREQTVEDLKGMLTALADTPAGAQYTPAIIAVLLDNISGVGMDPLKELNRRIMLSNGLIAPENEEDEAFMQQLAQAQQGQDDPQEQLVAAAVERAAAETRNLDAASIEKTASAALKEAQTVETLSDVENERIKTIADVENDRGKLVLDAEKQAAEQRREVIDRVRSLPVNGGV